MNLLRISYFMDAVDCGSFTRAAQKNFVSQPVISQQIAALEKELEVKLFNREKGRTELTPAGQSFYRDCLCMMEVYDQAVVKARRIHQEGCGILTVGISTGADMEEIYAIAKEFRERCPGTILRPVEANYESLNQRLRSGELDAAITLGYDFAMSSEIRTEVLRHVKVGLLVSLENPISRLDEVDARTLSDQAFVAISPEHGQKAYQHMISERLKEGYYPRVTETADSVELLSLLVALNHGVCFQPINSRDYDPKLCKMLRVTHTEDAPEQVIAYREDILTENGRIFIDIVKERYRKLAESEA